MDFELFKETGRGYTPKITIRKSGQIAFNEAMVSKFNIEESQFVQLFFDRGTGFIAIKIIDDASQPGIKKIRKRQSGADIASKTFFDFYDMKIETKKQIFVTLKKRGEMIILDLENETEIIQEETLPDI